MLDSVKEQGEKSSAMVFEPCRRYIISALAKCAPAKTNEESQRELVMRQELYRVAKELQVGIVHRPVTAQCTGFET